LTMFAETVLPSTLSLERPVELRDTHTHVEHTVANQPSASPASRRTS
jgi:hypothetical protein